MACRFAIAGILLLGILLQPGTCIAAQSVSYSLSGESGFSYAEQAKGVSENYALDGGITWRQDTGHSTNFLLVPNPPASSSSSSGAPAQLQSNVPPPPPKGGGRGQGATARAAAARGKSAPSRARAPSAKQASPKPAVTAHPAAPGVKAPATKKANGRPATGRQAAPTRSLARPTRSLPALLRSMRRNRGNVGGPATWTSWTDAIKAEGHTSLAGALLGRGAGGFSVSTTVTILSSFLFLLLLALFRSDDGGRGQPPRAFRKKKTVRGKRKARAPLRGVRRHAACFLLFALACLTAVPMPLARAAAPSTHVYDGHLLTASGAPVTTAVSIRFSEWSSANVLPSDILGSGQLFIMSPSFLDWTETHTVTPDSRGYFSVVLGSESPLPDYAALPAGTSVYLQVEVKAEAAPLPSFELLDTNPQNPSIDRSPVLSVPFALEATTLRGRSPGSGSGAIPVLGNGGLLPSATVPGGTNADFFTIDADGSSSNAVLLRFGSALQKVLSYDIAESRFEFNDSVHIQGDLTVSGLVNGINLGAIESAAPLKLSASGALNAAIAAGKYRINGTTASFAGSGGVALRDDATNYIFFTASGLTVSPVSFPSGRSYIPVAEVTTADGAIESVTDQRVLQSDDREETVQVTLHPAYEGASFQADGSNNVGRLSLSHDNINLRNFYLWTSTKTDLQDYDILLYATLPPGFARWTDGMTLAYRSTSASADNNALMVQAYDTNGTPVSLSGSTVNLASTNWTTTHVEFLGSPTWTAGQKFMVRFRMSARSDSQMHLGELRMSFDVLRRQ